MNTWWARYIKAFKFARSELHCVQHLRAAHSLTCCSDGSSDQNAKTGSFGFSYVTDSWEAILHGWGPVEGHRPSSFRAEITGAIAATLLALRVFGTSGTLLPDSCPTIGELARVMAPIAVANGVVASETSYEDVLNEIRHIAAEQMQIPLEDVKPESEFVRDLGM